MKKLLICSAIAVCLFSVRLHAQETNAEKSADFYTDSIKLLSLNFAKKSAYYLSGLPEKISTLKGQFGYQQGHFIPSQGSTGIKSGELYTEGTTRLKSVKLYGSFNYKKIFEDSTRFAHQTRNNLSTPYYFGSPGYVHYERGVYNFMAMASKSVLTNKLTFSLGTDYTVANHFSTNDPRGAINEYQLDINASVAYQLSPTIKIGLGYRPGYGTEDVNVAYKNQRYYESSVYPMYYNHMINGYGEGKPVLSGPDRKYTNNFKRNGLDFYLDIASSALGNLSLYANYTSENQSYFRTSDSGFRYLSYYDLDKIKAALLWLKSFNSNNKVAVSISYQKSDGKDSNLDFNANNYIYTDQQLDAKFVLTRKINSFSLNHYLNVSQYHQERIDGITSNDVAYSNLVFELGSGLKKQLNKCFFGINLAINYKMPLNDIFFVPQANEGYFTRYVIYYDYLYNTSSYIGGSVAGEYGIPVFKTMQASIKINATYLQKNDQKTLNRTIVTAPGKDRFSSNISLNLYF